MSSRLDKLIKQAKDFEKSGRFYYLKDGKVTFMEVDEMEGMLQDEEKLQKFDEIIKYAFTPESIAYRNKKG